MSKLEIVVRRGTEADHPFIMGLGQSTLRSNVSPQRSAPDETLEVAYRKLLGFAFNSNATIFIATIGGGSVGFALAMDSLPDDVTLMPQIFLAYMAVIPEARKRGVARAMFEAIETWGREIGIPHISLMVTEVNEPAMKLYASLGFETERRLMCKTL